MAIKAARLVNLVLTGLLTGNEVGTWLAVHPALGRLGTPERIRAEQELTRSYAAIMPLWMASAVISCLPVLLLGRGTAGFRTSLLGTLLFAAMLVSTRLGNVPINNRTMELDPERDGDEFVALRERWHRLHTLRIGLTVSGFGLLAASALGEGRR